MEIVLQILKVLFYIFNAIIAFYFLLPVILLLLHYIFSTKGKDALARYKRVTDHNFDFAAIVTAHQDTRFIAPLVDSFLKQKFSNFLLYIVADDCAGERITFDDSRVIMLYPPQALHSKIKSAQYAIDNFIRQPDTLIIFDSDNLVHPMYLQNLNRYFQAGFRVVQTHMLSKNIDNTYARLDSMGHIYYTFYERQVKMGLGMSSAILGLGIALDFKLYKEISYANTIGGFDKKLQSQLGRRVKQIAFAEDAIVYDEKVEDAAVLETQRIRWIYSYFHHFEESLLLIWGGVRAMNPGRFLLGATMLRPPMVLLMMSMVFIQLIWVFLQPAMIIWWAVLVFLFVANFVLTIATKSRQKGMMQSLKHVPLVAFVQIKSLMQIKKAQKSFLKTEHKKIIYIDDLLKNELT